MPEDDIEVVRGMYRDWERGDVGSIVNACDPGIEITQPLQLPYSKTCRGRCPQKLNRSRRHGVGCK